MVRAAQEAGANALTLVNTLPGLILDPESGVPALGAGAGGVSGPALKAVGLHAVSTAARLTELPLIGVGGIGRASDAVEYLLAGASLVQIGTASFWDPRTAQRVVHDLRRFGDSRGIRNVGEIRRKLSPGPPPVPPRPAAETDLESALRG